MARRAFAYIVVTCALSACGSDLGTVQCTSNAQCASNRCEGGICVSADLDVAASTDVDDGVSDVGEDAASDAADDSGTDAGPADADVDSTADVVSDVVDATDVADAMLADASHAADAFDAPDLPDVPIDPELLPPTGLSASDGAAAAVVTLTWEPVDGAEGYRVYRDGTAIADVEATTWDDLDATRGAAGSVATLDASTDDALAVTVTWPAAGEGTPGAVHRYEVATLRGEAVSDASDADEGYTAASPVAGYDIDVDGEVAAVDGRSWRDTSAAPGSVTLERVTAEWIGLVVQLRAVGAAGVPGMERTYRVRALTEAGGVGPWSAEATGRRMPGALGFVWERSAGDADAAYSNIGMTAAASYADDAGPSAGQARYYRVQLTGVGAESVTSAGVRVERPDDPAPDAPTGVNASDGTSAEHVTVTWSEVSGATSYDVYRDGALVASAVTGTSWQDTAAEQGDAPQAPRDVSASMDRTEGVRVSWNMASQGSAGRAHSYTVASRNDAGAGAPSAADTGFRAAPTVTGYEVSIDGGPWQGAGTSSARSWDDTGAPSGTLSGGTATASDGTSTAHVSLSLSGESASPGATRSYRVRAVASDGRDGTESGSESGGRAVGPLTYQWQRTSIDDSSGTWSDLPGATSASWDDSTAPSDGAGRWYRCVVDATGAESVTSSDDRGYRSPLSSSALGATCSTGATCDSGYCGNGRCAPQGFSYIAPGTFSMGSPLGELGRDSDETQHSVTLTRAFFMQQTEVTQGQWQSLMGNNPSSFDTCGADCPVERVTWYEALAYANALSDAEGLARCYTLDGCSGTAGVNLSCSGVTVTAVDGNPLLCAGYRLPTESEWEYAARAGTTTATYLGDLQSPTLCDPQPNLEPIAWFCENAGSTTHAVSTREANIWALYDMLGNVWEWCWDWYGTYPGSVTDPLGAASGSLLVLRGGSWGSNAWFARAAFRLDVSPGNRNSSVGFRLARTAP